MNGQVFWSLITKSLIYFKLEIPFFFLKRKTESTFYPRWSQLLEHYLSWDYPVTISSLPRTGRRRKERDQAFLKHLLWHGFVLSGSGGCWQCCILDHSILGALEASPHLSDRHNALRVESPCESSSSSVWPSPCVWMAWATVVMTFHLYFNK